MTIQELNALIRSRRSVYPPQYNNEKIEDEVIMNILENANWAPTHKLTQPWRFVVMKDEVLKKFGLFMSEKYRNTTKESFSIAKYEKMKMNPQKAGAVIAICMARDEKTRVPEWEEYAAVAMAVQNMWLTCHGFGIGAYWSSPDSLVHFQEFHPLAENERCIGLFYMGYYDKSAPAPKRTPIEDKVTWLKS